MQSKNDKIRQTLRETKERRKQQTCHVYELKVDKSYLSPACLSALQRLFLEAKWFYNAAVGSQAPADFDYKTKQVEVKVKEQFETRELTLLSAQMRQGLLTRIKRSLSALSTARRNGKKVGALKYKPVLNSIPLTQFDGTHKFIAPQYVRIQKLPEPLRVFGAEQLGGEIANANLIQRAGGYYLMVTCYRDPEPEQEKPGGAVGLDLNIEEGCQIVTDCGIAIGFDVPVPASVKRLQKKQARQDRTNKRLGRSKHTSNREKTRRKLQKAHQQVTNVKKEIRRQVVHILKTNFSCICLQKECFRGWQRRWGKRVQGTALAGILEQLETLPTAEVIERFVPTSKTCSECRHHNSELTLGQQTWVCSCCGALHNRHVNAARNMLWMSGSERAEEPVERQTSARILWDRLKRLPHVRVSLLGETGTPWREPEHLASLRREGSLAHSYSPNNSPKKGGLVNNYTLNS